MLQHIYYKITRIQNKQYTKQNKYTTRISYKTQKKLQKYTTENIQQKNKIYTEQRNHILQNYNNAT